MSLKTALSLLDDDPDEAVRLATKVLREEPDNTAALFLIGTANARAERFGVAIPMFERVTRIEPTRAEAWNNLGMSWQECGEPVKARECFKRALEHDKKPNFLANIAASYLEEANPVEAKRWCRKALELDPSHEGSQVTMGFAHLACGEWKEGWQGYEKCLGGRFRLREDFGAPDWDGTDVDSLVIYGEQGLGDEVMYASCIEDALRKARKVTLECDPRLEGLFRRSFPTAEVHGTRRKASEWAVGRTFDAQCAIGSLPSLFRPDQSACPRKPYLLADPERVLQWKSLFKSWGKPVIGLCWSGGRVNTQKKRRSVGLEAFKPLIERTDAVFVSLQYTDATAEIEIAGCPVRHYGRAVESPDYDDTAAFIAGLDKVVGIHTTAHHVAGALGVPSTILVPSKPMWNYAHGDELPWYGAQKFHRQKPGETWADCVKRIDL